MTERPILFSAPMVRALLAGTKTQTRRALKRQPDGHHWQLLPGYQLQISGLAAIDGRRAVKFYHSIPNNPLHEDATGWATCPYGQPSDRLWVRETFSDDWCQYGHPVQYRADGELDSDMFDAGVKWRPSIHMPRLASRITLEVTGVRVEQLQDISRGEAMAEGCPFPNMSHGDDPRRWYADLWEQINGDGSWEANPWVWVVEFKKIGGAA